MSDEQPFKVGDSVTFNTEYIDCTHKVYIGILENGIASCFWADNNRPFRIDVPLRFLKPIPPEIPDNTFVWGIDSSEQSTDYND